MTKQQIREVMRSCIEPPKICRVSAKYSPDYYYYFPLIVGERLFLGAEENDFILDGYSIRRITDIVKAEARDDKCLEIAVAEGLTTQLQKPDVDISDWRSVFESLKKMDRNIIIEKESRDEDECEFWIGRIIKVCSRYVLFLHFDADGIWEEKPYKIPYSEITRVSFGARYVDVFSKYLSPCPID